MAHKGVGKTVFSVTIITILSRLMSLVSVQLYFSHYGTNDPWLNIYSYALNAPNIIFTCIGTLLTTVVVPTYSAMLARNETQRGAKFLNNIISISTMLIACLVALCFVLVPYFYKLSPYGSDPDKFAYAVFCLRVLLPVMFFYGLNFIFQGILQSHGKFKLTAAVTIPSSLTIILYVLTLGDRFGVTGLVFATLIGLSLQAVFLLPSVLSTGYRYKPSFDFKNPEIMHCAKSALPVLVAVSAYQINTLFNLTMALRLEKNAIMSYVQNIVLVSILAFIYAVTAVYYPRLSILWSQDDRPSYKDTLSQVVNTAAFFLIPATIGFILIRYSLFDLIARWGKVTAQDTTLAGNILALYALGIVPIGFKEILDRAFYAQKNTKISAVFGFVIMGVNIVLSLVLINGMGIYALPLSFSISSVVGVFGLMVVMGKQIGGFNRDVYVTAGKALAACLPMIALILLENKLFSGIPDNSIIMRGVKLVVPVVTGGGAYLAAACALKMDQMQFVLKKFFKS